MKDKGYKLIKIGSKSDLAVADMTWVLDLIPYRYLHDCCVDIPEVVKFEPIGTELVRYVLVVHNRVFLEELEAYKDAQGNLYLSEMPG